MLRSWAVICYLIDYSRSCLKSPFGGSPAQKLIAQCLACVTCSSLGCSWAPFALPLGPRCSPKPSSQSPSGPVSWLRPLISVTLPPQGAPATPLKTWGSPFLGFSTRAAFGGGGGKPPPVAAATPLSRPGGYTPPCISPTPPGRSPGGSPRGSPGGLTFHTKKWP